jgi:hypothetical protein
MSWQLRGTCRFAIAGQRERNENAWTTSGPNRVSRCSQYEEDKHETNGAIS